MIIVFFMFWPGDGGGGGRFIAQKWLAGREWLKLEMVLKVRTKQQNQLCVCCSVCVYVYMFMCMFDVKIIWKT